MVEELVWHRARCHCGTVVVEAQAAPELLVQACNCSMCSRLAYLHLIVPRERFRLLQGEDVLSEYRFNTGVAQHRFCRVCGVKVFYVPRSNPNGFSVNARCIDSGSVRAMRIEDFDGVNWEANSAALADLA